MLSRNISLPRQLLRRTGLIISVFLLTTAATVAVCLLAPLSYTTSALVLVQIDRYTDFGSTPPNDAVARQEQGLNTLERILSSEDLIRQSVEKFGVDRLYPDIVNSQNRISKSFWDIRLRIRDWMGAPIDADPSLENKVMNLSLAAARAQKALKIEAEPKTDLIRVSFSHRDPKIAAEFANALLSMCRLREIELSRQSGAAEFFVEQRRKYAAAYESSLSKLNDFAASNQLFSVDDQRRLTLERRNELLAAAAKTRNDIIGKQSEAAATDAQLANLKPLAQYPQIEKLREPEPKTLGNLKRETLNDAAQIPGANSSPPLLLVRVYQETVQALVRLKAEIAGLSAKEDHQNEEIQQITKELEAISSKGVKFSGLELEADQARTAAQQYAAYAAREQVTAEAGNHGLSSVSIAQNAAIPSTPSFPDPAIALPFGMAAGLVLGIALALLRISLSATSGVQHAKSTRGIPLEPVYSQWQDRMGV